MKRIASNGAKLAVHLAIFMSFATSSSLSQLTHGPGIAAAARPTDAPPTGPIAPIAEGLLQAPRGAPRKPGSQADAGRQMLHLTPRAPRGSQQRSRRPAQGGRAED